MALTQKQMGRVTLDEFEAMAKRFSAALTVLRDAQAIMGPVLSQAQQDHLESRQAFLSAVQAAPPGPIQVVTRAEAMNSEVWRDGLNEEQQTYLESQRRGSGREKLLAAIRGEPKPETQEDA